MAPGTTSWPVMNSALLRGGSAVPSCLPGTWLAQNSSRHPLVEQRAVSATRGVSLEGRTHLDALLLAPSTGFAVHFEAEKAGEVLSDVDTKTKHDALRNQLARNLDCLWDPAGVPALRSRRPDSSVLLLLTPELFRKGRPVGSTDIC